MSLLNVGGSPPLDLIAGGSFSHTPPDQRARSALMRLYKGILLGPRGAEGLLGSHMLSDNQRTVGVSSHHSSVKHQVVLVGVPWWWVEEIQTLHNSYFCGCGVQLCLVGPEWWAC